MKERDAYCTRDEVRNGDSVKFILFLEVHLFLIVIVIFIFIFFSKVQTRPIRQFKR